jgi:hypothetical protein
MDTWPSDDSLYFLGALAAVHAVPADATTVFSVTFWTLSECCHTSVVVLWSH